MTAGVTYKSTRIPGQAQGIHTVTCVVVIAASATASQAFVLPRAFAAVPIALGLVRVDNNGVDVGVPVIDSLTALGGTLKLNGTSTVEQTYHITFVGDLNNPTAY